MVNIATDYASYLTIIDNSDPTIIEWTSNDHRSNINAQNI